MTNLVIMKEQKAVTSSLQVAEGFDKQHKHVLEAIENKMSTAENSAVLKSMFYEDVYVASNGKTNKMYFMNRDGFTFIAMGFTGSKADEFKLKYIEAFNEMEYHIKQSAFTMSQEDIMIATLENQKEIKKKLHSVSTDVDQLKNEIDLSRLQKSQLSKMVRKNVMDAVGGKKSNAYKELYRVAIAEHWREIKNYFNVASYEEIPKIRFGEALEAAEIWRPSMELQLKIRKLNTQIEMEV